MVCYLVASSAACFAEHQALANFRAFEVAGEGRAQAREGLECSERRKSQAREAREGYAGAENFAGVLQAQAQAAKR